MEIIPGLDAIPADIAAMVITIGMFDGVHKGHQKIIHIAHENARELGLRCIVFTFDRHPLEVLRPGAQPKLLSSPAQKLRLLEELDVDMVLMAHFDMEFSRMSAVWFVEEMLARRLKASKVVLGENFNFGRGREGNVENLTEIGADHGIEVKSVPLVRHDGQVISSTLIRNLIEEGRVEEANERLAWDYFIEGLVVKGDARGRKLGFPTSNIEVHDNRCIPSSGVYAGEAYLEHKTLPAVTYIGNIPTFVPGGQDKQRIEVHIPGWEEELYGRFLGVSFRKRLRGDQAFESAEALKEQIEADVRKALE
jgi:riboflavin kinase / FMN adenylyltransferase